MSTHTKGDYPPKDSTAESTPAKVVETDEQSKKLDEEIDQLMAELRVFMGKPIQI